jgi:hypothetical protein
MKYTTGTHSYPGSPDGHTVPRLPGPNCRGKIAIQDSDLLGRLYEGLLGISALPWGYGAGALVWVSWGLVVVTPQLFFEVYEFIEP